MDRGRSPVLTVSPGFGRQPVSASETAIEREGGRVLEEMARSVGTEGCGSGKPMRRRPVFAGHH